MLLSFRSKFFRALYSSTVVSLMPLQPTLCFLPAAADGSITKELEAAIEKMNTYNAWEIDAEAKRVLEAVGIPDPNQKVGSLSGAGGSAVCSRRTLRLT